MSKKFQQSLADWWVSSSNRETTNYSIYQVHRSTTLHKGDLIWLNRRGGVQTDATVAAFKIHVVFPQETEKTAPHCKIVCRTIKDIQFITGYIRQN